jgi:ABC-type sugar transport system substrate-binding protein
LSDKVVVALPDLANEFQHLQRDDARAVGARLGMEVEILDADRNAVLQIQQLFKYIHMQGEKPRAMVVEPVAVEGMERVTQKAAAAGIGMALLNTVAGHVDHVRKQHPQLPIFTLGSDQVEIGRMQARQIRALLPGGGTVLYIQGPMSHSAARERLQGTQEIVAGTALRLVLVDALWTEESAEQVVRKWLRLKTTEGLRIELVACQDDAMARGARKAFEATPDVTRQWGSVHYIGIDGVPSVGQRMVKEGQLTATVVMPSNTGPALEAVSRWLRTGTMPAAAIRVPITSFPPEDSLRPRG